MKRTPMIPLIVAAALFISGTSSAVTLYRYDFDNGTSGSWTPATASWTICKTVATGTPEYCQTDATAQLATTSFDGDVSWSDYSVQADVKLYNYLSGEDWDHRPRAGRDSLLSTVAEERADDGKEDVVDLARSRAASRRCSRPAPSISRAATTIRSNSPSTSITSRRRSRRIGGLTFDSLGFAEDTQYRTGKIGLMTTNTKGVFDNVGGEHAGGAPTRIASGTSSS